jgi:hypothetical protein
MGLVDPLFQQPTERTVAVARSPARRHGTVRAVIHMLNSCMSTLTRRSLHSTNHNYSNCDCTTSTTAALLQRSAASDIIDMHQVRENKDGRNLLRSGAHASNDTLPDTRTYPLPETNAVCCCCRAVWIVSALTMP